MQHTTTLNLPQAIPVGTEQTMSNPVAGVNDFSQYKKEVLQSITVLDNRAKSLYQTEFNIQDDLKNKDYGNLLWHLGEHKLKRIDISSVNCQVNLQKLYSIAETIYDLADKYKQMGYDNAKEARKFAEKVKPGRFTKKQDEYNGNLNLMTLANYLAMKNIVPMENNKKQNLTDLKTKMQDYFTEDRIINITVPAGIILFFGLIFGAVSYQKKLDRGVAVIHSNNQSNQIYTK
jgi:hypothetical protein